MRQGCLRKSVQVCVHPIQLLYSLRRVKSSRRERGEAIALLQQQLTRYDQSACTNGQVQLPLASVLFIRHCKCFTFIIWPKPPNRFTCMQVYGSAKVPITEETSTGVWQYMYLYTIFPCNHRCDIVIRSGNNKPVRAHEIHDRGHIEGVQLSTIV